MGDVGDWGARVLVVMGSERGERKSAHGDGGDRFTGRPQFLDVGCLMPYLSVKKYGGGMCHRPWYWREHIPAKMARLAKGQTLE
jgi:hypothetical protein